MTHVPTENVVRLCRFVVDTCAERGHTTPPVVAEALERLSTWEVPSAPLRLIRHLQPRWRETSPDRTPEQYVLGMLWYTAVFLNERRSRPHQLPPARLSNCASSALWSAGYAGADAGSGRVCGATVRAVMAGSELP